MGDYSFVDDGFGTFNADNFIDGARYFSTAIDVSSQGVPDFGSSMDLDPALFNEWVPKGPSDLVLEGLIQVTCPAIYLRISTLIQDNDIDKDQCPRTTQNAEHGCPKRTSDWTFWHAACEDRSRNSRQPG